MRTHDAIDLDAYSLDVGPLPEKDVTFSEFEASGKMLRDITVLAGVIALFFFIMV